MIIETFKKCGIGNAIDGTEYDAVFQRGDNNSSDESNSTETEGKLNIASVSYVKNK